jgi:hypothetical protein
MTSKLLVTALATLSPALFLVPVKAAAPPRPEAVCARDLAATDTRLRQTQARLNASQNRPMAQRCTAFRSHVQVMRAAAAVFDRCTTGRHRQENVGQMMGSIADWREIIQRNCR